MFVGQSQAIRGFPAVSGREGLRGDADSLSRFPYGSIKYIVTFSQKMNTRPEAYHEILFHVTSSPSVASRSVSHSQDNPSWAGTISLPRHLPSTAPGTRQAPERTPGGWHLPVPVSPGAAVCSTTGAGAKLPTQTSDLATHALLLAWEQPQGKLTVYTSHPARGPHELLGPGPARDSAGQAALHRHRPRLYLQHGGPSPGGAAGQSHVHSTSCNNTQERPFRRQQAREASKDLADPVHFFSI